MSADQACVPKLSGNSCVLNHLVVLTHFKRTDAKLRTPGFPARLWLRGNPFVVAEDSDSSEFSFPSCTFVTSGRGVLSRLAWILISHTRRFYWRSARRRSQSTIVFKTSRNEADPGKRLCFKWIWLGLLRKLEGRNLPTYQGSAKILPSLSISFGHCRFAFSFDFMHSLRPNCQFSAGPLLLLSQTQNETDFNSCVTRETTFHSWLTVITWFQVLIL